MFKSKSNRLEDALLNYLVHLANEGSVRVGVTLTVRGVIISGTLISYERYYDGIVRNMSQARVTSKDGLPESHNVDNFIEHIKQAKNITRSQKADEITFVHLENAVIYNDMTRSKFSSNFWRIKLDSIDAFMIGMPEQEETWSSKNI